MCVCIYKPIWSNVLFKAIVFLLIFCLDDIAIGKTGVLKSPKIVVLLSVSHFQFSSVAWSCPTLCDPMDCSTPVLLVHQQLPVFTQTHVHWVSDAIQPSHPLLSPSPPTFNLSQHQGLFRWIISLHQVAKLLECQFQHQSFQWIFRTDFL